ncbi:MAG: hypothetical protein NVS9B6_10250 [Candidatus Limnocylindrales bacterium]
MRPAQRVGEAPKRMRNAADLDQKRLLRDTIRDALDHRRGGTVGQSRPDEGVAVALVSKSEEELPRPARESGADRSTVVRATGEGGLRIRGAAHDAPTARGHELFEREHFG